MKVLGIGDNVVDYYINQNIIYPGGNALNFSIFSSILGINSGYLGIFGDDAAANHVYDVCIQRNIDLSHCRHIVGENGCAMVSVVDGERTFLGSNSGGICRYNPLTLTSVDLKYISQFDLLHTSIFSYIEQELPKLRESSKFISMDCSDKGEDSYFEEYSKYLDCVCISCGDQDEGEILRRMERIVEYGCRKMVISTRGSKGALLLLDGKIYRQAPFLVKAKDTMGAGDSFITRFLIEYISTAIELRETNICDIDSISDRDKDILIEAMLYKASVFAAKTCLVDGSSGCGKAYVNSK